MPSVAEAAVAPISNKKRRREDFSTGVGLQLKVSDFSQPGRSYETFAPSHDSEGRNGPYHRQILSPKRRSHDSKRQRVGHLSSDSSRELYFAFKPLEDTSLDRHSFASKPTEVSRISGMVDLSPCHICRRKPTLKSELDGFGDCECCGERICYICTRRCEGPGLTRRTTVLDSDRGLGDDGDSMVVDDAHLTGILGIELGHKAEDKSGSRKYGRTGDSPGHRDQICSECCIEWGPEGEIWCLGCLRAEEAV